MRLFLAMLAAALLFGAAGCDKDDDDGEARDYDHRSQINEQDFVYGQYFWLTNTDRPGDGRAVPSFRELYRHYVNRTHIAAPVELQIRELELYASQDAVDTTQPELYGRAAALEYIQDLSLPAEEWTVEDSDHETLVWRRLEPAQDYTLDLTTGVIGLAQPLLAGTALAATFTLQNGDTFGTLPATEDSTALVLLWPRVQNHEGSATWNLMFRHVYRLYATDLNPSQFRLTIAHLTDTSEQTSPPGSTESFLSFFDFDRQSADGGNVPDGQLDNLPALIRWDLGELHFLDLTPFNPSGYYDHGEPVLWSLVALEQTYGDYTAPYLYTQSRTYFPNYSTFWKITADWY